jgi:hypothetical protein
MTLNRWLSRSPRLLAAGLIALALGFFIEWRGWWNALFGVVGVALIAIWTLADTTAPAARPGDRRSSLPDRRRHAMPVGVDRRTLHARRALGQAA